MPAGKPPTDPAIYAQVTPWVHRVVHMWARQGKFEYPAEKNLIVECWHYPVFEDIPDWADALAEAGEPGSQWCPILTPELRSRA